MNINEYLKSKNIKENRSYWSNYSGESISTESLLGMTILSVDKLADDSDVLCFDFNDRVVLFCHNQDCCECVSIDDIVGDFSDLIGSPLLLSEESTNSEDNPPEYADSFTWTFYKFATIKGYVDIKWLGESNGYYSESVDVYQYMK